MRLPNGLFMLTGLLVACRFEVFSLREDDPDHLDDFLANCCNPNCRGSSCVPGLANLSRGG